MGHFTRNFEWFVTGCLWLILSTAATNIYPYESDLITRLFVISVGMILVSYGFRPLMKGPLDSLERLQLRWIVTYILFLFLMSVPLIVLTVDCDNFQRFAESQLVTSAPMFGLSYHFVSVGNLALSLATRRNISKKRKQLLFEIAHRYNNGALIILAAAVVYAFCGLVIRYSLVVQAATFSFFLLKLTSVLVTQSLFTIGFFHASKVSRWYII